MPITKWLIGSLAALALVAGGGAPALAQDKPVKIRIQSVIPKTRRTRSRMLEIFAENVNALTNGTVTFEVLPAGAVVGVNETLDAVDKGLIEGGFAWTHYWSGKHPAAMLFGSPIAGAGVGLDNFAWLSWYLNGGGKQLYDQLWVGDEGQRQGLHPAAGGPRGARLVQEADQQHGRLPQAALPHAARHPRPRSTRRWAWRRLPWAAATSCPRSRRACSTPPSGAARSPT